MAKTKAEQKSIVRLPTLSESMPTGMLKRTPVKEETAAIVPTAAGSAPRYDAKSGRTGLFEIVELKIALKPATQRRRKGESIFLSVALTKVSAK